MRIQAIALIAWGTICALLFLVLFVSQLRSGHVLANLYMAATLTGSALSISSGRKLLDRPS